MNKKRILTILAIVALFAIVTVGIVSAGDDGQLIRRNVSKTPDTETEKAAISMMSFYVPAQSSDPEINDVSVGPIGYFEPGETPGDQGALIMTRGSAKPLIYSYIDGIEEEHEEELAGIQSGLGMGARDTFVAHSLDDGLTWKRTNVSSAAHLSSFTLADGHEYPGDSFTAVHAVAGDKVLAAWISRYCTGGSPAYARSEDADDDGVLDEDEDLNGNGVLDLYQDLYGIAGDQKSIDYAPEFPDVGELPFGCVWTARGQLLPKNPDDLIDPLGGYDIIWTKPERLTSGRRDANRLEIAGANEAGFAITWQEDPQGLRPGQGLGPGEGWSGAIVNAKTDIWYSFITWEDFDKVCDPTIEDDCVVSTVIPDLREYNIQDASTTDGLSAPKVLFPMAIPVRMTDNNICQTTDSAGGGSDTGTGLEYYPYCFADFTEDPPVVYDPLDSETDTSLLDFCVDTFYWVPIDPNPDDANVPQPKDVCVTEDGRVLIGRVGASRPRIAMHPYLNDTDGDGEGDTTSAWVIIGYEETKAMGEGTVVDDDDFVAIDIGKNMWYHSFEFSDPDYISHGNILNQPAMNPLTYDPTLTNAENFYELKNSDEVIDLIDGEDDYNYDFYETEITRRFSLISQDASNAGESGLVAYALVKQGMINQGGPADIFGRRFVLPDGFDSTVDNPYAFEYMACDNWNFNSKAVTNEDLGITDAYNPYYPGGICLDTPTNISGVEALTCVDAAGEFGEPCPTIAQIFPDDDGDGVVEDEDTDGIGEWDLSLFYKVDQWVQCGPGATAVSDEPYADLDTLCGTGTSEEINSLDNQSWENPFDIAKGHRGFLDGDFLMVMYAWSPNYKANKIGNDHYNLYARRSFDGGDTWTTTPVEDRDIDYALAYDGMTVSGMVCTTENYLNKALGSDTDGDGDTDGAVEYCYPENSFEQARNLSQLTGTRETILDPRYSPTSAVIDQCMDPELGPVACDATNIAPGDIEDIAPYVDDETHVASNFFIVYETGDNTTVEFGEATPLDLFYSRATSYGDLYEDVTYAPNCSDLTTCPEEVTGWDALENKEPESGEAGIMANPAGTFFYAGWNQVLEIGEEEFTDMDAYFRRVLYIDDIFAEVGVTVDRAPIAEILYVSSLMPHVDDQLLVIGTARDGDHIDGLPADDIADYEWTDTYMGIIQVLEDDDGNPKRLNIPAGNLHPGWHGIGFKASDKGGRWSPGVTVNILVTDGTNVVFLPLSVSRP